MTTLSDDILTQLEGQGIELPSWAFGNSGTRFRVWTTEGTPRDPREKWGPNRTGGPGATLRH